MVQQSDAAAGSASARKAFERAVFDSEAEKHF
jgi:hypothetical protein